VRSGTAPFIGADSYYFLNNIFYNTPLLVTGAIGTFLIGLLPQNIILIKVVMYLITLLTIFIGYECARLYSKKNALIYSFSLIAMFTFSLVFFKLEDDLFALPFLFSSLYFIIKYQLSKTKSKFIDKNIILSLFFLFISVIIWKYSVLFILMYLFITNFHFLYILASFTFVVYFKSFIFVIIPHIGIAENQIAFISGNIAGGIIILLFFLYLKKNMILKNRIGIYVFSVLTLLNFKIIYILMPILLLNNIKLQKSMVNGGKWVVYLVYIMFLIGTINQIITLPPTSTEYDLAIVGQFYSKALNKNISYPWGLGYFYIWNKIPNIQNFGTIPFKKIVYTNKLVIINKNNPQVDNCELLQKEKWYQLVNCP
jgi:hypothetical protein